MFRFSKIMILAILVSLFSVALHAQSKEWKFIVTGDSRGDDNGVNTTILTDIRNAIMEEKPVFVLFPGDLISGGMNYEGTVKELQYWQKLFMAPLQGQNIKVYPIPGNHDLVKGKDPFSAWNKVFSGKFALPNNGPESEKDQTYSIYFKDSLFVGLNVYAPGNEHKVNMDWFSGQLNTQYKHLFVFAHDPAYSLAGEEAHKDGLSSYPDVRNLFIFNIIAHRGKAYFAGHDHWYDHAKVKVTQGSSIDQFIVGTAGAPLRKWEGKYADSFVSPVAHFDDFGYMVVTVTSNAVICDMKKRTGPGKFESADVTKF
jgi:hypothetical protein